MTREEAKRTLEFFSVCSENHVTIAVNSRDRQAIDIAIEALEQPERKKGKWGNHGECPFCSYLRQWEDDRFCGNCGADMRGEQK